MNDRRTVSRRQFLGASAAAALAATTTGCARVNQITGVGKRPNIVLLVTDDHRFDLMGCMGNPVIQTPNMDALATGGALFTNNFCTTSICASSRAGIMTGMYTRSNGISEFNYDLPQDLLANTYFSRLRDSGYRTGFVGKYGVGGNPPGDAFDYWKGWPGQGQYWNDVDGEKRHLTDMLRDDALEFIEGCDNEQPFCLSVSFKAPHTMDYDPRPWQPATRFEELYKDATIPVSETATEADYEALPDFLKDTEGRKRWENRFRTPERYQETMKDLYRLLTGVDEAIGKMRAQLEAQGLVDNTVIIYTGDNGFYLGERGLAGKWYAHEESLRTPLIIHDPRVSKRAQGIRPEQMSLNIDLAPTILDMCGVAIPETMQGKSLTRYVNGKGGAGRDDFFYEHLFKHPLIPASEAIRTKRWKYIRWILPEGVVEELFDLRTDPQEKHNLADSPAYAARLDDMRTRWKSYKERLPERKIQ